MPLSESILASCVEPGHLATMSKIFQAALNTICTLMLWKFFLLTKTASSSDGAIILTCVPSITPTTPGNPAMSINALLCVCKVRASSGNETNCVTILGCDKAVSVWVMTLLTEDWDRPKSSLLHCCIFPVAKYLRVVITFFSGVIALWRRVGEVIVSLRKHDSCTIQSVASQ